MASGKFLLPDFKGILVIISSASSSQTKLGLEGYLTNNVMIQLENLVRKISSLRMLVRVQKLVPTFFFCERIYLD